MLGPGDALIVVDVQEDFLPGGTIAVPGSRAIEAFMDPERDAYSGFNEPDLEKVLRGERVGRLFIGGLALDYCVRATALDAVEKGFSVALASPVFGVPVSGTMAHSFVQAHEDASSSSTRAGAGASVPRGRPPSPGASRS